MTEVKLAEPPARSRAHWPGGPRWDSFWLVFGVGAVIRLVGLDRLSFWFDEAWAVWYSRQPVAALVNSTYEQSFHPPLYYVLLHYWLLVGDSAVWTRLLSALFGIITIPVVYHLGRMLFGRHAGLAAAWLLALSPWHVWYSQEVHMYAMVVLLAALSLLGGIGWLRTPSWRWGALYAGSALVGLYTNYTMLAIWPVEALVLLWLVRPVLTRGELFTWILLQGLVVIGYLPQLLQMPAIISGLLASTYLGVDTGSLGSYLGLGAAGLTLLGLIVVAGWLWVRRQAPSIVQRLAVWGLLLGWFGSTAMMIIPGATLPKRQLSILIPVVCLGAAWALTHTPRPAISLRNLALLSALAVLAMIAWVPKEPWREVVADLHRVTEASDFVIIEPEWMTVPFDYYDRGQMTREWIDPSFLNAQFAARLQGYKRIWLVLSSAEKVDPRAQAVQWFTARYALIRSQQYYHITVQLYAVQNRP
jgi:mannosyltransferase